MSTAARWPAIRYSSWSATCDTLHAHTQVLGKLAVRLAPAQPQLQHAALRLTARGWETEPLPAPDDSGALVVALDLHAHEAVVEHSDGRSRRVPLTPDRPVGEVTRDVLGAVRALAGPVEINPKPQEVPWSVPLDEDEEHATYDPVAGRRILRRRHAGRPRPRGVPRPVPRTLHAGQRLVGHVRPRHLALLRTARRPAARRLHRAQRGERRADRDRLVARRRALRPGRVLRLRAPHGAGLRACDPLAAGGPLGAAPRGVHPRLGRRPTLAPTRTPRRSSSRARRSSTPARRADGIRSWPRSRSASRRPWAERTSAARRRRRSPTCC